VVTLAVGGIRASVAAGRQDDGLGENGLNLLINYSQE